VSQLVQKSIANGIDQRSARNAIKDGYVESLENFDTSAGGYVHSRKGWRTLFGSLPLRVKKYTHTSDGKILIQVDSSQAINLGSVPIKPLLIQGFVRNPAGSDPTGDFGINLAANYYTTWELLNRRPFTTGLNSLDIGAGEHGIASASIITGFAISESSLNENNTATILDSTIINSTTFDITQIYDSPDNGFGFSYVADKSNATGIAFNKSFTSSTSCSITAAEHGLNNYNIMTYCYDSTLNAGSLTRVIPQSVTISTLGTVTITFGVNFTGTIIVTCTDLVQENNSASLGSNTFTISSPGSSFNFVSAQYLSGGVYYDVIPDNITYNQSLDTLSVDYTLSSAAETVRILWENATIVSNILQLDDLTGDAQSFVSSDCDLYIWGISHESIYKRPLRGGHISHLDSYKALGESYLIAGLGGNLFKGTPFQNISDTTETGRNLAPSYTIFNNARVNSLITIAPLFNSTATGRTRGEIVDTSVNNHKAEVSAVTVVNATTIDITLKFATAQTIGSKTSTFDKFTLSNMPFSDLNATYGFVSVITDSSINPMIRLSNSGLNLKSRYTSSGIKGSVWSGSDAIVCETTVPFSVGDIIQSTYAVVAVNGATVYVNVSSAVSLGEGLKLIGSKQANTFILSQSITPTVENMTVGDMIILNSHEYKIVDINVASSTITINDTVQVSDSDVVTVSGRWLPITTQPTTLTTAFKTTPKLFRFSEYDNQVEIKSTMMSDNMYFTNGNDEVLKYDGSYVTRAGLIRWQPRLYSSTESGGAINPATISLSYTSASANHIKLGAGHSTSFTIGDRWQSDTDSAIYTVKSIDTTNDLVYFTSDVSGGASGNILKTEEYRYYFKINAVDSNNNIVASSATNSLDSIIEISQPSKIVWKVVGIPIYSNLDYESLEIQLFRTRAGGAGQYYLVKSVPVTYNPNSSYQIITDNTPDELLTTTDIGGVEIHNQYGEPLRAKFLTTVNNKLVMGNLRSYPTIKIKFGSKDGTLLSTNLQSTNFEFTCSTTPLADNTEASVINFRFESSTSTLIRTISAVVNDGGRPKFTITGALPTVNGWTYLYHNTQAVGNKVTYAGHYRVYAATAGTVTLDTNYIDTSFPNRMVLGDLVTVPVWLGTDGNFAERESQSSVTIERIAAFRLSLAINSIMKVCDFSKVDFDTTVSNARSYFRPWLTARAGNDYGIGEVEIIVPTLDVNDVMVTGSGFNANFAPIINDTVWNNNDAFTALTYLYPSRLIQSITNFAEIFDDPSKPDDTLSPSARDINPSDGQEIIGAITFFGDSMFGSGQKLHDALILFKNNSIYAYDTESKEYQKLDTRGLGCSAPKSITTTKNGIMFANEAGIYRINRDLTISFVGEFVDRIWKDLVNKTHLVEASGHQNRVGGKYKLCVPFNNEQFGTQALVYDIEGKPDMPYGAWSLHSNHKATVWCNLDTSSYFGSSGGLVKVQRNDNDAHDFQDEAAPISLSLITRSEDFNNPGIRKVFNNVILELQMDHTSITDLTLSSRTNLSGPFSGAGTINAAQEKEFITRLISLPDRRGNSAQLKITHATQKEEIMISSLVWDVDGLASAGIEQLIAD
jgi:hypothetical protein